LFTLENIDCYRRLPTREKCWHVLTWFCGVVIVAGGCQLCHWFWVSPPDVNYRSMALESLSPETEVLIVGTSHVERAVRPDVFTHETMGISARALDYVCMEAVLNKALDRAPAVALVVLEVDYVPLYMDHIAFAGDRELADWGVSYRELKLDPLARARTYLSLVGYKRFTPSHLWLRAAAKDPEMTPERRFAGYVASERVVDASRDAAKLRALFDDVFTGDVSARQQALIRMIQGLEARGIQVRLLRLPMHESYWAIVRPEWERTLSQTLELIRAKTDVGPGDFWDYSTLASLEAHDYRDADHLNGWGAVKFSHLLDGRVESQVRSRTETLVRRIEP